MAQAGASICIVDRLGDPDALVVASAMLDASQHRADQRLGLDAYYSSDTTHLN
jgi:hypothetical protein